MAIDYEKLFRQIGDLELDIAILEQLEKEATDDEKKIKSIKQDLKKARTKLTQLKKKGGLE